MLRWVLVLLSCMLQLSVKMGLAESLRFLNTTQAPTMMGSTSLAAGGARGPFVPCSYVFKVHYSPVQPTNNSCRQVARGVQLANTGQGLVAN
jgi:hypothetical protein